MSVKATFTVHIVSLRCLWILLLMAALTAGAQAQTDLPGFPKTFTNDQTGAPLFFDFDGDGVDELLHANADYTVDIYNAGGTQVPGWPATAAWHVWNMTPSVGDLDGDGTFEVVTAATNSRVYAFHADGATVAGFPRYLGAEMSGACCLADLDGDNDMEILVQPRNNRIYALQGDGTNMPGWPVTISIDESGSQTPAVADLDNDGQVEIVTTSQGIGSLLGAYRADGTPLPGFPVTVTYIVGSPVLADLDRDDDLEIIYTIGSDLAARHHDGTMVAGFPVDCGSWVLYTCPAVGDLDRDGYVEIVFGSQDDRVNVVRHDGTFAPGWPSAPTTGNVHGTPCLADLDFDGDLEILVATPTTGSGRIYGWHHDGSTVTGFPWTKPSSFYGGPALGDLNDDGKLDVAAVGRSAKALYAWTTAFNFDATRIVHGCYRVNRHNNAVHNLRPVDGQIAVTLDLPSSVMMGNTFPVGIRVSNNTPFADQFVFWLQAETLDGLRADFLGPFLTFFYSGQSASGNLPVYVPNGVPVGGYRFVAMLFDMQGHVIHHDAELLTIY